ncbi:MAG TPA: DNA helicase RecQ [Chloroflexota bacterium]|nr:DNA helicase RecQ [Chloroflexota bacterium]
MTLSLNLHEQALRILRSTFGFTSFRPLQEDVIHALIDGRDVFVLMPTGGGKSLCYQLPALVRPGLTVVVSPLIALMKDQVDALRAVGVDAAYINSSLSASDVRERQAAVSRGELKILYVAPERLMMPTFLGWLKERYVSLFAIDEAHCISEWGHDFRPEYRQLRDLRGAFPDAPIGAFTATATSRVQEDIKLQLGLQDAASFRGSFNRANLIYEVRSKKSAYEQILAYLRSADRGSGIIYCQSRTSTEELAAQLRRDGFTAAPYHAGLDQATRSRNQEAFVRDDVQIIVATIAFGMGIDKPDVRFVMHYDLPKNLEGYYQESGRAGRDGERSDCMLFYSGGDSMKHEYFIQQMESPRVQAVARAQLRQVQGWAESSSCRREALLEYFDESLTERPDPCCDVCRDPGETEDATVPAQMLLSCAVRTGERFGVAYLIEVLRGARSERIVRFGHDAIPTHGVGRGRSKEEWSAIARQLVRMGFANQDAEHFNALKVTGAGRRVLAGQERVTLVTRTRAAVAKPESVLANPDLFEELRRLRKTIADERNVPPYVIFHDRTLQQMAGRLPATVSELIQIPGIGTAKASTFGEAFLEAIRSYASMHGLKRPEPATLWNYESRPAESRGGRRLAGSSMRETLDLFWQGKAVADIARERGLALSTIENHLAEGLEAGEEIEVDRLLAADKLEAIKDVLRVVGDASLTELQNRLGDEFSYAEIRMARALKRYE